MAMKLDNSFGLLSNLEGEVGPPSAAKELPSPAVEERLSRSNKASPRMEGRKVVGVKSAWKTKMSLKEKSLLWTRRANVLEERLGQRLRNFFVWASPFVVFATYF